jgi:hypothetical protein
LRCSVGFNVARFNIVEVIEVGIALVLLETIAYGW